MAQRYPRIALWLALLLAQMPGSAEPQPGQGDLRFVVLGDRTNQANQSAFQTVLEDVRRLRPDLVVTVGDLIQGYKDSAGTAAEWDSLLPCLKILDCPVYLTPGNHDITTPGVRGLFTRKTGFPPYYSFSHRGHRFIILDNSQSSSERQLDPEQLRWLEKELASARGAAGIHVLMHRPYWPFGVGAGKADRLHDLFRRHGVSTVFAGHWHRYASEVYDGIQYVVMGSSGAELRQGSTENASLANFYQFMWVTVEKGKPHLALIRAGNTFDPDYVSLAEETFAFEMPERALKLTGEPVAEGRTPRAWGVDLQMANPTEKPIRGEVTWKTGNNWRPLQARTPVEVAPGDTFRARFRFEGTGNLYPLPEMVFPYPFGRDKVYLIDDYAPDVSKLSDCPATRRPPELDGKIGSGEWDEAARITEFCDYQGRPARTDPTEVYLMHDRNYLYLAAVCHDDRMTETKATKTGRDSRVTEDDHIGFLLSAGRDTVRQIYFNPRGTIWDRLNLGNRNDERWNGRLEAAAARGERAWQLEVRIPAGDLGLASFKSGIQVRMNIRRKQQRSGDSAIWVYDWSYQPERFGIISLK